jgi:hypothetical protein
MNKYYHFKCPHCSHEEKAILLDIPDFEWICVCGRPFHKEELDKHEKSIELKVVKQ